MQVSNKRKIFSQLFTSFLKSTFNSKHFEKKKKKMRLIAYVFLNLQAVKYVLM